MTIHDPMYGTRDIASPCLRALLESPSVLRLRGIAQFGLPNYLYYRDGYSRFDHSVGVMALLSAHDASEEEQIAGLLHDVSHTAFSHIADWTIGDPIKEDLQDKNHERFIRSSELPEILERYKFDVTRITDHHLFPLLERRAPALCADRLDYTLRELPHSQARKLALSLRVHDRRFIFVSQDHALDFAQAYLKLQENHWGGFEAMSRYHAFGNTLKHALSVGIITKDDFWTDDAAVLTKLSASGDQRVLDTIALLGQRSWDHLPRAKTPTQKKFRWIDPAVLHDGKSRPLSVLNPAYGAELERAKQRNAAGIVLAVVSV